MQETIEHLSKENFNLLAKQSQSEELRKILHSQLQEYKGPIKVFCRVKPTINKYIEYPEQGLNTSIKTICVYKGLNKSNFIFDKVFTEESTQEDVFKDLGPYVQTAVDGGKVCVFSYGQTGSGKTFTLEGSNFLGSLSKDSGVLPRAGVLIYAELQRQNLKNISVFISCIEVYLDNITDLLDSKNCVKKTTDSVYWEKVNSIDQLLNAIFSASEKRITRETNQNVSSSRSHTVYQIKIEGTDCKGNSVKGRLSVIDLAGSEKPSVESFSDKSSEEIENMKKITEEGKFINKSLSCLKRVFDCLSQKNKGLLPPYRENKLTKLLQDQLQSGEVVVIVTVSPDNYVETKESLKFGSLAQQAKV